MKETYEFRMQLPIVQRPISADLDELANIITQQGDVQQHNTNVKASMTEWDLNSKHFQVEKICNHAIKVARSIHPKSFNSPEFYTRRCWGASYTKNQPLENTTLSQLPRIDSEFSCICFSTVVAW